MKNRITLLALTALLVATSEGRAQYSYPGVTYTPVTYAYPTTSVRPAVYQPVTYTYPTTYTSNQPVVYTQPVTYSQPVTYQTAPATTTVSSGDGYGFTAWLNNLRASYGLAPVSHDANLAGWAAANNAQQAARGMGHHVMGPASRQNAAIGTAASIGTQWFNSPGHRALLLDPAIRTIGLAGAGMYWTLNAR